MFLLRLTAVLYFQHVLPLILARFMHLSRSSNERLNQSSVDRGVAQLGKPVRDFPRPGPAVGVEGTAEDSGG